MKVRNKKTGEIVEVPDGTPKERFGDYFNRSQETVPQQDQPIANVPAFLRGTMRGIMKAGPIPALRLLGNLGFKTAGDAAKGANEHIANTDLGTAGKVGETAADLGMILAPTPFSKIKAANMAVRTGLMAADAAIPATIHQVEEYGQKGKISPAEAAQEGALNLGFVGLGKALKTGGAGLLKLLTRAPRAIDAGVNPTTVKGFEQALDEGVVSPWSFKKSGERGMALQGTRDAEQAARLKGAGVRSNVRGGVFPAAKADIEGRVTGSQGLLPNKRQEALDALEQLKEAAMQTGKMDRGGFMDGPDAREFRKMLDKTSKFQQEKVSEGLATASRTTRRGLETDLLNRFKGKPGEAEYALTKQKMAELAPVIEALTYRGKTSYSPWLEGMALGGSAPIGLVTHGNPFVMAAPLAAIAARRVPAAAVGAYKLGKALGPRSSRAASRGLMSLMNNED